MQQVEKFLIALAFGRASKAMIFDEPTANLDPSARERFKTLLHRHIILIHVLPSISTNLLLHFIMKSTVISGRSGRHLAYLPCHRSAS